MWHVNPERRRGACVGRLSASLALALLAAAVIVSRPEAASCPTCVVARVWAPHGPAPETERLKARWEAPGRHGAVGVAFSGGGTRAATAAVGQLRGLRANGWLEKVDYVSAVSGGAWAAIPFAYSSYSLDELLGPHVPTTRLDAESVRKTTVGRLPTQIASSSLLAGALRELSADYLGYPGSFLTAVRSVLMPGSTGPADLTTLDKTYARMLADIFIDPLIDPNLKASTRRFTWDHVTAADAQILNEGRLESMVKAPIERPYLIVSAGVVSYRREYPFPPIAPVEYTPMYSGLRAPVGALGGTYLSSFAYDGDDIVGSPGPGLVTVRTSDTRKFTLADVAASTGAAPELFATVGGTGAIRTAVGTQLQAAARLFPSFTSIGVSNDSPSLSNALPHVDGGSLDNLGLMPLLARRVPNILVFVNTSSETAESNDDLTSLFASGGGVGAMSGDRQHNRVFAADRATKLFSALAQARAEHRPQVFCAAKWKVERNPFYAIESYDVNICFFYNAPVQAWTEELETPLLRQVKDRKKGAKAPVSDEDERQQRLAGEYRRFPYYRTFGQDLGRVIKLNKAEVNLLANLTAWIVMDDKVRATVTGSIHELEH